MGAHDHRPAQSRLQPLTLVGVLLLGFGVLALGGVCWQYYGTNVTSNQLFDEEKARLREAWGTPAPASPAAPAVGEVIGLLRIPTLGTDFEYPVVAGAGKDDLARGIGWYPHTAPPGTLGNTVLAGHRITHGEPFARLRELGVGARVVLETRDTVYTYQLTTAPSALTVTDADTWVLDPVPGKPAGTQPTERLLTLTTCSDLLASPKRSVAFARLVDVAPK